MAEWSSSYITALPDSAFACVQGKERFYPHHNASGALDLPHLRAALSRVGDASNEQCGKGHLEAHAKAEQMGERGKALLPLKAAPLEPDAEQAWFAGKLSRRLLAIPFGGPIPSKASPLGVDLDGEWFDTATDIYGSHRFLRQDRERLADWHHGIAYGRHGEPAGPRGRQVMGQTIIGKAILDLEPEEEGWWVDFWFKQGEQRIALIQALAKRGATLFGSSMPIITDVRKTKGHIDVWPFLMETLSTSPQNTQSTLRPMKAILADARAAGLSLSPELAEYLASEPSLVSPSETGETAAKAGRELSGANEAEIEAALEDWRMGYSSGMLRLKKLLERMRMRYRTD